MEFLQPQAPLTIRRCHVACIAADVQALSVHGPIYCPLHLYHPCLIHECPEPSESNQNPPPNRAGDNIGSLTFKIFRQPTRVWSVGADTRIARLWYITLHLSITTDIWPMAHPPSQENTRARMDSDAVDVGSPLLV
jgi:hypothetical protein